MLNRGVLKVPMIHYAILYYAMPCYAKFTTLILCYAILMLILILILTLIVIVILILILVLILSLSIQFGCMM